MNERYVMAKKNAEEAPLYILTKCWDDTYPCDGDDPVDKTYHRELLSPQIDWYRIDWRTRLSTFLGIPNRQPIDPNFYDNTTNGKYAYNLLRNFVGWPETALPTGTKAIKWGLLPFNFALNVVLLLPKIALNVLKLAEFGTQLLRDYSLYGFRQSKADGPNPNKALFALSVVGIAIAAPLHFIVRAITSPGSSVKHCKNYADQIAKKYNLSPWANRVLGFFFVLGSMAITTLAYSALLPLGAKVLATKGLPYLASHAPAWINQGINAISHYGGIAYKAIAPHVGPTVNAVGNFLGPLMKPILASVGASFSPIPAGIAAFTGLFLSGPGALINEGLARLKEKAYRPHREYIPMQPQFYKLERDEEEPIHFVKIGQLDEDDLPQIKPMPDVPPLQIKPGGGQSGLDSAKKPHFESTNHKVGETLIVQSQQTRSEKDVPSIKTAPPVPEPVPEPVPNLKSSTNQSIGAAQSLTLTGQMAEEHMKNKTEESAEKKAHGEEPINELDKRDNQLT